jgi:choline dehydrogenase-like flavoprotein
MSAQTLVDAGKQVTMLDVGAMNPDYDDMVPEEDDFLTLRRTDPEQYRYFLGSNIEGVVWGDVGKGAQVTPGRSHMARHTDTHIPLRSETFSPLESLGYGGLGIGWGVQCWQYSQSEMQAAGLDPKRMASAYETVSKRIGVSGVEDDASDYTLGTLKTFQKSPDMDRNHRRVQEKFESKKDYFTDNGFHMGRTPLALITEDKDDRKAYAYRDMDFYTDKDRSAWRPWMTINELRKRKNFTYMGGLLVLRFTDEKDYVEIECLEIETGKHHTYRAKQLVLATGALGSARVVLRSLGTGKEKLPLLCNPYTYVPCLQPAMIGKAAEPRKMGFAQLSLFLDEQSNNFDISVASLYSYQSLMMFRVIKQIPFLGYADARPIMQYLMSGIVIMGVHHPDKKTDHKYLELVDDVTSPTGDALKAHYELTGEEQKEYNRREDKMMGAARKMGLYALQRVNPGYGSSVHYAGTLPFASDDRPFTLGFDGKLHGTDHVYVADSSGFNYLPSRGLTFSLLANAHVVAEGILRNEQK